MDSDTVSTTMFAIKTDAFEGPLDLLLELVEKHKLLINDISLAAVTDEYMSQVSLMQELSLPNTVQFVQIAATLLLIKSKSLLPVLELTSEEEQTVDDLEARLMRYALYRDSSLPIIEQFGKAMSHERLFVSDKTPLFVTDLYTTVTALERAISEVIINLPKKEIKPRVQVRKAVSLEEMIERLRKRIENAVQLKFSELIEDSTERGLVIVGFLAILESVKQGSILVTQAARFEEIEITREQTGMTRYM